MMDAVSSSPPKLSGPFVLPEESVDADMALVFLHGYGSDGDDLIALAPLYAAAFPKAAFFSPNGPHTTVFGAGYQWFSDNNYTFIDKEGIDTAKNLLAAYIQENILEKHGIPSKKVYLVGFSQGTMTALYAAPRFTFDIGGVIGFSGRMMWAEELEGASYKKPPIHLIHGVEDDVLSVEESRTAAQKLKALGFEVSFEELPRLGHGIDERAIKSSAGFLKAWEKERPAGVAP